ncbi:chorismate mutase [Parasphaerochaeta coccoides]|uniref:chorismate mutase n=1 Tax=Parasphaerochaeta coccoides (strain ATCC BAA-1237 / DSM 17374 / SPN1) TaxID=760011 RepID=F4GK06_PARC1|nr:chorismate mutase [Parasphaerochaeta coccoides]AEC01778.1 chorismate mutase [Parasphaerochaeta coccoides DSM 17374]
MQSPTYTALRGAIQVEHDVPEDVDNAVKRLFSELLLVNAIDETDIGMIFFTMTSDLHSRNPAASLRKFFPKVSTTALFCMQEAEIDGMLEKVIRILIVTTYPLGRHGENVYMDGARVLRPEFAR